MKGALRGTRRLFLPVVAAAALGSMGAAPASAGDPLKPKSVPVQVRLAEAMAENEDWDEAIRRWIDILCYFGPSESDARAHFEIGGLLLRRGRSDLAAAQWEKTVRLHPESEYAGRPNQLQAEAMYQLGVCHQRLGRLELAKTAWQHTVSKFSDSSWSEEARSALARASEIGALLAAPYALPEVPPS